MGVVASQISKQRTKQRPLLWASAPVSDLSQPQTMFGQVLSAIADVRKGFDQGPLSQKLTLRARLVEGSCVVQAGTYDGTTSAKSFDASFQLVIEPADPATVVLTTATYTTRGGELSDKVLYKQVCEALAHRLAAPPSVRSEPGVSGLRRCVNSATVSKRSPLRDDWVPPIPDHLGQRAQIVFHPHHYELLLSAMYDQAARRTDSGVVVQIPGSADPPIELWLFRTEQVCWIELPTDGIAALGPMRRSRVLDALATTLRRIGSAVAADADATAILAAFLQSIEPAVEDPSALGSGWFEAVSHQRAGAVTLATGAEVPIGLRFSGPCPAPSELLGAAGSGVTCRRRPMRTALRSRVDTTRPWSMRAPCVTFDDAGNLQPRAMFAEVPAVGLGQTAHVRADSPMWFWRLSDSSDGPAGPRGLVLDSASVSEGLLLYGPDLCAAIESVAAACDAPSDVVYLNTASS